MTDKEIGLIEGLKRANYSERVIAEEVGRSRGCVRGVLARLAAIAAGNEIAVKPPGPKPKISERLARRIVREASEGHKSASRIHREITPPYSVRTTRRLLAGVDFLEYEKMDREIDLTPAHKAARLAWAKAYVTRANWGNIVFSDEKKFNFDGPDGAKFYWRDVRRPGRTVKKRQMGGGSIMVFGAFSAAGKTELFVLVGRQASRHYIWTVSDCVLPFAHLHYGHDFLYQQDNASIHVARETREFLREQNVSLMEWPARSPDLNPIENVWAAMSREVYADGKQYNTVQELKTAVMTAWDNISPNLIAKLVASMPNRCVEVSEKQGGKTHY